MPGFSIKNWDISDFFINSKEIGFAAARFGGGGPRGSLYGPSSGSALLSNNTTDNKWAINRIAGYNINDIWFSSKNTGTICGGSGGLHYFKGDIFITVYMDINTVK